MSLQRSYRWKRVEIAALNDAAVTSDVTAASRPFFTAVGVELVNHALTNSTPTVVKKESTDGLDNVLYSRPCLEQSHRATKCPSIPLQLRNNLI